MRRYLAPAGVLVAAAALAVLPAPASADLFAITEVTGPGGDTNLARFVVGSGAQQSLPSSINTSALELHPALSPDGTKLAYWSFDRVGGTTRIVVVNLGSGTSADLINAFDAQSIQPNDPSWLDDGHVAIGRFHQAVGGSFEAAATRIDITGFPNGPFSRGSDMTFGTSPVSGRTLDFERRIITANNKVVTVTGLRSTLDLAGQVVLKLSPGTRTLGAGNAAGNTLSYDHPTISRSAGVIVVQRGHVQSPSNQVGPQRLSFTDANLEGISDLPEVVNATGSSETRPEFSADGRYLAFVRHDPSANPRLFVWDTDTQLMVKPGGIDLGPLPSNTDVQDFLLDDGSVTIGDQPLILNSSILSNGLITFRLASLSTIGIIVQKVVGRTKVLGRAAPRLRFIGRVPLGKFVRGRGHIRWDRRVGGKPLAPGRYQITVRSVTPAGGVRDLGRPVLVRIPAARRHG